jgi:predicted GIY-YIG superfamily endonuclease
MIKLTNILRELFTASKNTANFELLAELKINEIDNMLNEAKYDYIGTDIEKAKEAVETWRAEWKEFNPDKGEPTSNNLSEDPKEKGGNNVLWKYIKTNFINKGKATWSDFGFPVVKEENLYPETIGTNIEKAKEAVEKWRAEWKSKNPDKKEKEPIISNLKKDSKEKGGNVALYSYIYNNFIKNGTTWSKFGFPPTYSETIGTNIEKAKEAVEKWRAEWKLKNPDKEEPIPINLQKYKEKGGNVALYSYIYNNFIKNGTTWSKFGFPPTYSETIGTNIEKAKAEITDWKEKWKLKNPDKEPTVSNLSRDYKEKGGNVALYNYIKNNIFPLMDGEDFQNWLKLGLESQIYWSKYTKEDFKEHIKQLKLVYPEFEKNNYIYELLNHSPNLYRGILGYIRKQNFNNVQRRNFWNDIGMQYVPQDEKLIYAYEFININGVNGDNRVYVGLTNDPNRRYGEHIEIGSYKSSLNDFKVDIENQEKIIKQEETIEARENPEILKKEKNKLTAVGKFLKEHPEITSEQINYIIKTDFMNAYEAADKESEILNGYLNDKKMNWKKLNIAEPGSLGGGYNSARKSNLKIPKEERNKASDEIARNIILSKNK